jgi:Zn-dependent M28 family amino/carboxypeptidase
MLYVLLALVLALPPAEAVEESRLMEFVRALPEKRSLAGDPEHAEGVRETERLIVETLREIGYEPTLHEFAWAPRRQRNSGEPIPTWNNIIVEIPGVEIPGEMIIVGAHFDAVPAGPGADDNGSGTAGLMEIARVLHGRPMKRTVRLIFFNGEEVGLVGSLRYVAEHLPVGRRNNPRLIGMISLEMLGYFTDEPDSQRSPLPTVEGAFEPPTVGDFIAIATTRAHADFARRLEEEMRRAGPGLRTFLAADIIPDFPLVPRDILRSDHAPFLMAGLPGVMITDTANFRNPHYHRATDTADTLDPGRFAAVVRGVAGAVYAIAEPASGADPDPVRP